MRAFLLIFSLLVSSVAVAGQGLEILPRGKEAIYKAEFNVTGTSFNGFLAVHHKRTNALHVQFTSPMGNNLLEMEWKRGRWKKVYAIKKLSGRHIYPMLAEDLLLLFAHYQFDKDFVDQGNEWLWNKKRLLPVFENGQLHSVKLVTKRHHPTRTVTYGYDSDELVKLSIDHQGFPFSIVLEPLKKK